EVEFQITLLSGRTKKREYSTLLRIDEREILLSDTLKEQTEWFLGFYPQTLEIPQASEEPLYSTWYNFHQHPSANALYEELKIARGLGFKSVIIDDGWQYDGKGTADYIDCGDWAFSKEKFPEPKVFIDAVHALGMKVAFWFPVPFVGFHTQAYQRFKDKLLYEEGSFCDGGGATNAGILDVRYKETRDYIVNTVRALMIYGVDGVKLDFVDKFKIHEETPSANPAMDFQDLNEAVVRLLQDLNEAIHSVKSDTMIEFRQNYVGPSITRFCNMLRVADCAFDSITNRIAIADMRMLGYRVAVHSDMLYWAEKESEENVSRQLLNVAFAVPQISVRLKVMPQQHRAIIKTFLTYWTKNRGILLKGKLTTEGADSTYVMLSAENVRKKIVVLYLANDFTYMGKRTDVWNASRAENIFVDCGGYSVRLRTIDRYGKVISEKLSRGIEKAYVPIGGRIECDNENGKIKNT
ncbi:MAG: glycoside hydrolase family 36 protein, partial [Candidatus Scatosoma sp.]